MRSHATRAAELAARQRRRRRHAARDEAGLGVEVEGEADDVAGHWSPDMPGVLSALRHRTPVDVRT